MIRILFIIITVYLITKTVLWYSDCEPESSRELRKALRYSDYNLSYIDKVANVIALGAKVVVTDTKTQIVVPTKGFWQLSTNAQVRACLKHRMDNDQFRNFMLINFDKNLIFSNLEINQNNLVKTGMKPLYRSRRHRS